MSPSLKKELESIQRKALDMVQDPQVAETEKVEAKKILAKVYPMLTPGQVYGPPVSKTC
jgi:hypothetical protein